MASRDHPSFFDDVTALPPPPANLVELGKWIPHTVEFSVDLGGDRQRVLRAALRGRACGVCSIVSSGRSRGAGFPYAVEQRNPELFDRRARRGAGAARGGARVQLVDRNADVQGSRSICRGRIEALILARRPIRALAAAMTGEG